MKKSLLLTFILLSLIILAQLVSAIPMSVTADLAFVEIFNWLLFGPTFFILMVISILIGLMFHRKFIIIWNTISIYTVIFLIGIILIMIKILKELYLVQIPFNVYIEKRYYRSLLRLIGIALLYSSFFTIIAFLSSNVARRFKKISNLQEVFNRVNDNSRILILFSVYLLFILPIVYASFFGPLKYSKNSIIIGYIIMGIAWIIISIGSIILFYRVYMRAKSLLMKELIFDKKDYLYFVIILLIFFISLLLYIRFWTAKAL